MTATAPPAADLAELRKLAARIRLASVRMVAIEGFGYLGQALSAAEVFAVLFGTGAVGPRGARFVLSPAHYAIVLYAAAAQTGLIDASLLEGYGADGSVLEAISTERTPLVDLTCGSLGQGLSGAIGLALADRLAGSDRRTIAFLSDGELEEGQVWEAATFAAHARLESVTVVLDANGSQVDGPVASVTTIEPIAARWQAFGWAAAEVNGHDVAALQEALATVAASARPGVVIARTDTSGGLRSLPEDLDRHFIKLTPALVESLVGELEVALADA
jgi:transketolase